MTDVQGKVVHGTFLHAPTPECVEVLEDALISVDESGQITRVLLTREAEYKETLEDALNRESLLRIPDGCVVIPGFVDLHVHACQYPQLGEALDAPLEVWLQQYTFPLEAKFADTRFAQSSYPVLVNDLLRAGTTTATYFATLHQEASKILARTCMAAGQRALVGRVVMDDPSTCPSYYRDASADQAVRETREFIEYVRQHPENGSARVAPAITPRFIPACTDEALSGLGDLARDTGCHVQTHCSESDWEHAYVKERLGESDTRSLDRFGLIGRHTVLAHCNFISDEDMALMAKRGAGVAHCAESNAYFANAVFPLRRALEKGVRVGLGTDIAGGPAHSMFSATRMTMTASRMLEAGVNAALPEGERGVFGAAIDFPAAFHLATAGGGDVLGLPVGAFTVGNRFDALMVDTRAPEGTIRLFGDTALQDLAQKIVFTASHTNIRQVWVDGRQVAG